MSAKVSGILGPGSARVEAVGVAGASGDVASWSGGATGSPEVVAVARFSNPSLGSETSWTWREPWCSNSEERSDFRPAEAAACEGEGEGEVDLLLWELLS